MLLLTNILSRMILTIINVIYIIRLETRNVSLSFPTVTDCDPWFVIIIMMVHYDALHNKYHNKQVAIMRVLA